MHHMQYVFVTFCCFSIKTYFLFHFVMFVCCVFDLNWPMVTWFYEKESRMCESEKFLRKIGQQVAFAIAHSQQKAPVNLQSDCIFWQSTRCSWLFCQPFLRILKSTFFLIKKRLKTQPKILLKHSVSRAIYFWSSEWCILLKSAV